MRIRFFSAQKYDRRFFDAVNQHDRFALDYLESPLNAQTARLAEGADAVCAFVNDTLDAECLQALKQRSMRFVALRCAGFNQLDRLELPVPACSPEVVAEHTLVLDVHEQELTHRLPV